MENFAQLRNPEVVDVPSVIFRKRLGIREYEVHEGDQEKLGKWFQEIQSMYAALSGKDMAAVLDMVDRDSLQAYTRGLEPEQLPEIIEKRNFDEEGLKILAISLWVFSRRPRWKGSLDVLKRFALGGEHKLSSFMDEGGVPNCLDTSVLVKYFAEKLGVKGETKDTINEIDTRGIRFLHWYFQSDSGIVSDIWEGYRDLGVYMDEEEFKEKRVAEPLHCCAS